ncbi:MAG: hypothetical protein ACRCUP_01035 [Mycoplasmatales bacterium]
MNNNEQLIAIATGVIIAGAAIFYFRKNQVIDTEQIKNQMFEKKEKFAEMIRNLIENGYEKLLSLFEQLKQFLSNLMANGKQKFYQMKESCTCR